MLDALISGKIIRDTELKISAKGAKYTQFLLSVGIGEESPTIISGVAFGEVAERIAELCKGDALAVVGALKPSSWNDKDTGELKHGLSLTVNQSLSVYDISKKRKPTEQPQQPARNNSQAERYAQQPVHTMPNYPEFNDQIPF
jgi:single-strand DNA-binding protein